MIHSKLNIIQLRIILICGLFFYYVVCYVYTPQALVSFQKYMPPPLPYCKVNIYPFPLPHFASIFFAYL